MSHEYLTDLNKEQRRAVKHGLEAEYGTTAPPLLVIVGAGSGKTKTLAHRVAHLSSIEFIRTGFAPDPISEKKKEIQKRSSRISLLLALSIATTTQLWPPSRIRW